MDDVVDHLPISRSCRRSFWRCVPAALPQSVTRAESKQTFLSPFQRAAEVVDLSMESQQHDGVVVVVEVRILQGFTYACAEERWRREAAEIGSCESQGKRGRPSLLFKGGRRAWGGGVLVGLPSLGRRWEGGRNPPPPRIRVLPHFDSLIPFLVFK